VIREAWRKTARKNALAWVCLTLFAVIFCEVISFMPMPPTWHAFLFGFVAASFLACLAWMVYVMSGIHGWSLGKLGEEATAETVLGRKQRRQGWRLINGIYMAGHGDIDHVLVSPGGVFAIESKWTSSPCRVEEHGVVGLRGREPVSQAREGARKIERLLQYGPQRFEVEVTPVVVTWGPGSVCLDSGWTTVDGVLVCEGRRDHLWMRQLEGTLIAPTQVEAIASALEAQVDRQPELL
jgi:hypothetical protein